MKKYNCLTEEEYKYYKDLAESISDNLLNELKIETIKGINENQPPFKNEEQKITFYTYKEINSILVNEIIYRSIIPTK